MKKHFLLVMVAAVLLGGCADGLLVEPPREPADFSPDPAGNLPQQRNTTGFQGQGQQY